MTVAITASHLTKSFGPTKALDALDTSRHEVIEAVHPSPLSANRGGFFGTKPFSQANQALAAAGRGEIDWSRFEAPA